MRRRCYPSDMADAEWALLQPLLPSAACETGRGRPENRPRRDIVDGIRYVVDNGIKWRAMPAGHPPWRTIYGFAWRWAATGAISLIRDQLRRAVRISSGKPPQAVASVVDSQSVKASETVGKGSRGSDARCRLTTNIDLAAVTTVTTRSNPQPSRLSADCSRRHARILHPLPPHRPGPLRPATPKTGT